MTWCSISFFPVAVPFLFFVRIFSPVPFFFRKCIKPGFPCINEGMGVDMVCVRACVLLGLPCLVFPTKHLQPSAWPLLCEGAVPRGSEWFLCGPRPCCAVCMLCEYQSFLAGQHSDVSCVTTCCVNRLLGVTQRTPGPSWVVVRSIYGRRMI